MYTLEELEKEYFSDDTFIVEVKDEERIKNCLNGTACVYWGNGHTYKNTWVLLAQTSPPSKGVKSLTLVCLLENIPKELKYKLKGQ